DTRSHYEVANAGLSYRSPGADLWRVGRGLARLEDGMITRGSDTSAPAESRQHFKDAVLDQLAEIANVAQFVSFGPGATLPQRYSRVYGVGPNHIFDTAISAVEALLAASAEHSVNVRSFDPNQPQAHEFLYGLKS